MTMALTRIGARNQHALVRQHQATHRHPFWVRAVSGTILATVSWLALPTDTASADASPPLTVRARVLPATGPLNPHVIVAAHHASAPPARSPQATATHSNTSPIQPGPPVVRNRLVSSDGALDVALGVYNDCEGATPLPATAVINVCVHGRTYFMGHNPGVFTPLMSLRAGSVLTWYDGTGQTHRFRVTAVHDDNGFKGVRPWAAPGIAAQFRTCLRPDGSVVRVLDAVSA